MYQGNTSPVQGIPMTSLWGETLGTDSQISWILLNPGKISQTFTVRDKELLPAVVSHHNGVKIK